MILSKEDNVKNRVKYHKSDIIDFQVIYLMG